jgi:hypothetical protein
VVPVGELLDAIRRLNGIGSGSGYLICGAIHQGKNGSANGSVGLFPWPLWARGGRIFPFPVRIVESIHRLAVGPRDEVTIGIHGDLDGMVAHLVLHIGQGLAVRDQPRGERVPKIVEADLPKPCQVSTGIQY